MWESTYVKRQIPSRCAYFGPALLEYHGVYFTLVLTGSASQQLLAIDLAGKILINHNLLQYSLEHHLGHKDISSYAKIGKQSKNPSWRLCQGSNGAHEIAVTNDLALHNILRLYKLVNHFDSTSHSLADNVQTHPIDLIILSEDMIRMVFWKVFINPWEFSAGIVFD